MKLKYLVIFVLAAAVAACDDPRNDHMPAPAAYLVDSGDYLARFYDVETTADVNVYAYCSGFEQTAARVGLRVVPEALEAYNAENGTDYRLLDAKYYTLLETVLTIPAGERRAAFPVRFDCEALASLEGMQQYAVPLELVAEGDVPVSAQKAVTLLRPDMWKAEVVMTGDGLHEQTVPLTQEGVLEYEIGFRTEFRNRKDCDLHLDCSAAVLEAYNAEKRMLLKPFPEGAVEIVGEPRLAAGVSETKLRIRIDLSKVAEKGVYSIPVRLVSSSCYEVSATRNLAIFRVAQIPERFPEPLDRFGWTIVACNSYQAASGYMRMIDGDPATLWEARYSGGGKYGSTKCPFETVWDFGSKTAVNGIGLLRRSDASYVTDLRAGYFEVSVDNVDWRRVAQFEYDKSETSSGPFGFYFEKSDIRYLKLVVTASNRSTSSYDAISVAELYTCRY